MLIRALVAALIGLTLFAVGTPAPAQERLRLAWAGISPALSPIWAMQENRFLQKQGVDAQIVAISSSITVIQALMAGEIASLALSRMTVPVVYFIFNQRRSSRELEQSVVGGGRLYQDCRLQAGAWRSSR